MFLIKKISLFAYNLVIPNYTKTKNKLMLNISIIQETLKIKIFFVKKRFFHETNFS